MRPGIFLAVLTAVLFPLCIPDHGPFTVMAAYAQDDWKTEFEDVCSKTNDSPELTADELNGLIDRCGRLAPIIEKLDESQKRVYLRRLKMCADMFRFVLESRGKTGEK